MITLPDIQKRLAEAIKQSGLSQSEIARQLNVNKHRIYDAIYSKKLFYPKNYKYNNAIKKEYIL